MIFLSPLVYAGEIIILEKDDYSCALHKSTGVIITKGLAALGKTDVERKVSWGEKIHTALKDGKYKVIQDIAQKFIMEVLLR